MLHTQHKSFIRLQRYLTLVECFGLPHGINSVTTDPPVGQ
jgi:hypothetical protein